ESLRAELEAQAPDMLEVTAASVDFYHRVFGIRYPFGEYHQAFVPDFNAGAMENPGCVTFRDQYIFRGRATEAERGSRACVIAHEMAHQWFGDLVTMRWWDDLWLNESFAEYMGHRCCSEATQYPQWTEFGIRRKHWGSVADQAPSTHPVAVTASLDAVSALQNFDGISYAKGAAVLRQLVAYLGDDVFLAGLRAYFERYAYGNAEFAELIACWSAAGAVDLEEWAAAWLQTTGMDVLDLDGTRPDVLVTATAPGGGPSDRVHAVTVAGIDATGDVSPLAELAVRGRSTTVDIPTETLLVVPDACDATWAKVRFGAEGWSDVAAVLPQLRDETVLVVVDNAIRDAVRDGSLDSRGALDLLCRSVLQQESEVLLSAVLGYAASDLAGPFSPPTERAERLARVNATARAVLSAADAGSDRQLAAFRLAVDTADEVPLLTAWSEGRELPAGLVLDAELTWSMVERLAALGADPAIIDRTLQDDPSSSAAVHAARARASVPTAAAKEAAWQLLMRPSSASAYEVYATGDGFFLPGQEELTEPYVARYFTEVGSTAGFRHGWSLGRVAHQAFPRLAVHEETVRLAEATLRTDLADQLRRELVDGLDNLRRALASLRLGQGCSRSDSDQ
ncbi:MAG: M1 family aminopeptidase, partial [Friedmanniella sp.]